MPSTNTDLNPHISILDDPRTKRQIAALAERNLDLGEANARHPLKADELERARFQHESNALAEENRLYAAARSASSFLILPLDGEKPLVDPSQATRDPRALFEWWTAWPEANPGVRLGRVGGLFALRVEDDDAYLRLREMAAVEMRDPDTDRTWTEYRELGGALVRLLAPGGSVRYRSRYGWGKGFTRAVNEEDRERQQQHPQTFFLVYSYPSVVSGLDAFDYKARSIGPGLKVLGEGDVLPWNGSILEGDIRVVSPMSQPPEVPLWLAKAI